MFAQKGRMKGMGVTFEMGGGGGGGGGGVVKKFSRGCSLIGGIF